MRSWRFLVALLWLAAAPVFAALRAGAARTCITPPPGTIINGGVSPVVAKQIHDDLYVRALVLDDGAICLAFAVVDTCLLDRAVCDEAKKLIGLPSDRVLISATHTHSGGSVCGAHLSEADEPYRRSLPPKIAEAVKTAMANLAPAQVGWGSGSIPQHVFCRRLLVKEGVIYTNQLGQTTERVKMSWGSPHPADGEPAGPVDPELFVLSVKHADGRHLALLANYSLHYVGGVGVGDISADYFGVFAERIAELLGTDKSFVGILSNGTSGDINNVNPKIKPERQEPYAQIRRVAEDVAQETLRVTRNLRYTSNVKLGAALRECVVATRRPSAAEVEQARAVIAGKPLLRGWLDNYAREQVLLADLPSEVSMPLQVFRVGELAILAWPGEIFAASGLELKKRGRLFNIGLANGWYGYIPPSEQFPLGGYETWRMRTSCLETNAIPKMIAVFDDLLKSP